ncbi:hypothetical protein OROHE_010471 [Orobanche hederae]
MAAEKTRKTLCKFPQKLSCEIILCGANIFWTREIRDQIYDEKANTVTITVVCCSPEKIRDRLCCKGGKAIKSIEIKESAGPKEPPKKKKEPEKLEKPEEKEKSKPPPEKPKVVIVEPKKTGKPKEAEKQKEAGKPKEAEKHKSDGKGDKPKSNGTPPLEKQAEKPKEAPPKAELAKNPGPAMNPFPVQPQPVKGYPGPAMNPFPIQPAKGPEPAPVNGVPSVFPYVGPSYDGYYTGPYYHGYGFPPTPQPCYEGYYGHGYGYGYGGVENVNRGDSYLSEEENPEACSIM